MLNQCYAGMQSKKIFWLWHILSFANFSLFKSFKLEGTYKDSQHSASNHWHVLPVILTIKHPQPLTEFSAYTIIKSYIKTLTSFFIFGSMYLQAGWYWQYCTVIRVHSAQQQPGLPLPLALLSSHFLKLFNSPYKPNAHLCPVHIQIVNSLNKPNALNQNAIVLSTFKLWTLCISQMQ